MNTDLQTQRDTSQMTPIEIALQTDENGMVSAKKLYDFLELDPTHFTRWCERNLLNNNSLEEDVDFISSRPSGENSQGGRPGIDYKITKDVAKGLAMEAHSTRGKEVRQYYLAVESKTVEAVVKLQTIQNQLIARVEQLGKFMEDKTLALEEKSSALESRLNNIDGGETVPGVFEQKWADEAFERVQKLAERSCHGDYKRCIGELVRKIEDYGFPFSVFSNMFHERHPNAKQYRLRVIAEFDQLREAFDRVYDEEHRFWFNEDDAPYYDDFDPWEDEEEQIVRLSDGEPI